MEKITEKTMSLDIKVMPLGPISANCYILTDKKSRESAVIDPGDFNEALKKRRKGFKHQIHTFDTRAF